MKVVVAHNAYRSALPSGENVVVRRQIADLRAAGVDVVPYLRSSDELRSAPPEAGTARGVIGPSRAAATTLGLERATLRELGRLFARERPDVVHLHNLAPLIPAGIVAVAHRHGAAVVQTVHNYRHVCLAGTYFRDGHDCRDCVGRTLAVPGVRHECYRGSRRQSLVVALALAANRHHIVAADRVIALAPHVRDHCVAAGFPAERIAVVPNTSPDPGEPTPLGTGVLFAGRFSVEKGLGLLAEAWRRLPAYASGTLTIAGDGPERPTAVTLAQERPDVEYVGRVEAEAVADLVRSAAVVVVPSLWADVCPTVVVQAMAHGRAVLATDRGGLPYLIGDRAGWLVPASPDALADGLRRAVAGAASAGRAARERYLDLLAPGVVLERILEIYHDAIDSRPTGSRESGSRV